MSTSIDYRNSGVVGYTPCCDLDWLYQATLTLPSNATIVELGSFQGRSAIAIGAACIGTERHIHCVDKWEGTFPGIGGTIHDSVAAYLMFLRNIKHFHLERYITTHRGLTTEVAKTFDLKIDMLFIDASHQYKDVLADILAWFPKVKRDGIVSGHDWEHGPVSSAVVEIFGKSVVQKQKEKHFARNIWDVIKG